MKKPGAKQTSDHRDQDINYCEIVSSVFEILHKGFKKACEHKSYRVQKYLENSVDRLLAELKTTSKKYEGFYQLLLEEMRNQRPDLDLHFYDVMNSMKSIRSQPKYPNTIRNEQEKEQYLRDIESLIDVMKDINGILIDCDSRTVLGGIDRWLTYSIVALAGLAFVKYTCPVSSFEALRTISAILLKVSDLSVNNFDHPKFGKMLLMASESLNPYTYNPEILGAISSVPALLRKPYTIPRYFLKKTSSGKRRVKKHPLENLMQRLI
jgi:hypothetical protein